MVVLVDVVKAGAGWHARFQGAGGTAGQTELKAETVLAKATRIAACVSDDGRLLPNPQR